VAGHCSRSLRAAARQVFAVHVILLLGGSVVRFAATYSEMAWKARAILDMCDVSGGGLVGSIPLSLLTFSLADEPFEPADVNIIAAVEDQTKWRMLVMNTLQYHWDLCVSYTRRLLFDGSS
jgi:hypothetical protein